MTLNLIYVPIDMREFNRWAGQRRLIRHGTFDEGFALHVLLSGMFGKSILKPFRIFTSGRHRAATLYAYTNTDKRELQRLADFSATPDSQVVLDPQKMLSKHMPTEFSPGQRLGFDVRVRPVRRIKSELPDRKSGRIIAKGSEVDAFLVSLLHRIEDGVGDEQVIDQHKSESRENIYFKWLTERLGDSAQLRKEECHLSAFRRSRVMRGGRSWSRGSGCDLTWYSLSEGIRPNFRTLSEKESVATEPMAMACYCFDHLDNIRRKVRW